jgi:hypothetical protein
MFHDIFINIDGDMAFQILEWEEEHTHTHTNVF